MGRLLPSLLIAPLFLFACANEPKANVAEDAGPSGECTDHFGSMLTPGFGRLDGFVYAVVKPKEEGCGFMNDDHLTLQVAMLGDVYRMVVNVESDRAGQDKRVQFKAMEHALPEPAFSEGWHHEVALDYVTTLGVHSDAFSPMMMEDLVEQVAKELVPGEAISIYAESGEGRPESTHLVHRNRTGEDGAIVVHPTTAPSFFLFHFATQTF